MMGALRRHLLCALLAAAGCAPPSLVPASPPVELKPHRVAHQDASPKEELRLLPQEVLLTDYLTLSGGRTPLEAQRVARGADGSKVFDSFADYLSALGFPDYRIDLPRATQTNALMVATLERLAGALCERAVEHDLKATPACPLAERRLFAFELPPEPLDPAAFAARLDVLHRTFLGYPLLHAPAGRAAAFFRLYEQVVSRHQKTPQPRARLSPQEAGWVAVCYGLARHPEHLFY